jgi:2'-5' RNA ligase
MRLGLVLLPPPDIAQACVRYAEELVRGRRPRMVLGEGRAPHLTLLHAETDVAPEQAWGEAIAVLAPTLRFDLLALGLLRYDTPYFAPAAPPATMAYLIVPTREELRAAEKAARTLSWATRVTTGNGARFQPHFTLAIWEGEEGPAAVRLPKDLIGRVDIEGRLALGVIGPNGVYAETLFEANV